MRQPCIECGELYELDGRTAHCDRCRPKPDERHQPNRKRRGTRHQRGYDNDWARLSKRARELQPWCSDCGTTDDLTADHSTTAWQRRAAGKTIRLRDIDVVCRVCNSERGAARGSEATDQWRDGSAGEIISVEVEAADD